MKKPKFVAASDMVLDLKDNGYTQTEISKEVKVSQATISRILNGGDPCYTIGKGIEYFWASVTGKSNEA